MIDLESATPDVSRRKIIDADISDILARALAVTRPKIVENLNAIAAEGLLIEKLDYLEQCVKVYGQNTILEASLPWISFLKLPGEVELINCATLRERLAKSHSLFFAYGTGPWTAMKRWGTSSPKIDAEPAIVMGDLTFDRLPYRSGEEIIGKLSELWPTCDNVPLVGAVLRVAAEAWQVSVDELAAQDGWHHNGSTVWGRMSRPQ